MAGLAAAQAEGGSQAVELEGLKKHYGDVNAVDGLTLSIPQGEIFGLLGPNGSGKTTTINCLCGLIEPTEGKASVGGFDAWREAPKARAVLGVCPQDTAVYPYLSAKENVAFFGSLYAVRRSELGKRVDYVLDKVGLAESADRRVGKYSGGMKRRVSIAMALVHDPRIVFLDEPSVGMDPQSRRAVWDYVRELKGEGKTVLLTTHYMEEADALCDRVGVIDHGRLIELGEPASLKAKYGAKDLEDVFIALTGRKIREEA